MTITPLLENREPAASPPGEPLKVCYVIDRLDSGGTERQLLGLIGHLDRAHVEPLLCLLDGTDAISQSLEPRDCRVVRLGIHKLRRPAALAAMWRLARWLKHERVDVLQLHFPDSTYFAAPAGRLAGVRAVVGTRRDVGYWVGAADRRLGPLYGRWFIDHVLANSRACAQSACSDMRLSPDRVSIIPNGIDLAKFDDPTGFAQAEGPPIVGMTANLRGVKAPEVLVDAAAIVAAVHPDVRFQIAGEGPLHQELLRRIAGHALGGTFELLNQVDDVPAFVRSLRVAVLCSRSEGQANAILEYLAAARPVVVTAVGGNLELIDHEINGLVVPPDDPRALAAAILRLLGDPLLSARLAEAGRRRVAEEHAWTVVARRHEEFYRRQVAAQGRSARGRTA